MGSENKNLIGNGLDRKSYMLEYMREYRKTDRYKQYMKEYWSRPESIEKRRAAGRKHAEKTKNLPHKVAYRNEYRQRYHVKVAKARYLREANERYKEAAINIYSNGDACCKQCKIADVDVLCLDHIRENGSEHRRYLKSVFGASSTNIYRILARQDYPDGFQVLCYNCNIKKHREHRRENSLYAGRVTSETQGLTG